MPTLYVRDKETRKIIYIEESFSSLVWTERYQEYGDFVLDIPLNAANLDVYVKGNYISMDESDESMVIESVEMTEEMEDPTLEITGKTLSSILTRRINASKVFDTYTGQVLPRKLSTEASSIIYSGKISTVVQSILNDDLINPVLPSYVWYHKDPDTGHMIEGHNSTVPVSDHEIRTVMISSPERKIEHFYFESLLTDDQDTDISIKYDKIKTLYEILVDISKKYVVGFRTIFKGTDIYLQLYKGTDRTSKQFVLDPVIFNPVMDNISYVNYLEDSSNYKSTGFSYSDSGLNFAWKTTTFSYGIYNGYSWVEDPTQSGLDRYEVALDVRSEVSIHDLYSTKNVEEVIDDTSDSDEESNEYVDWYSYYNLIIEKVESSGENQFDEGDYDLIKTSEGAIDPLVRYAFDKDYFLGDVIEISNDRGVIMTAYIDEVVRSYDTNGFITTPNFKNMEDYDYGEEDDS